MPGRGVMRAVKGIIKTDKGTIRAGQDFQCCTILYLILKYKRNIKTNLNVMVLIQEIIHLK